MSPWQIIVTSAAIGLALGGCGGTGGEPGEMARLRLVHAAGGGPVLDVLVGGEVVLQGVAPAQVSRFAEAPAGNQMIVMRSTATGAPLGSLPATLQVGADYTVMVTASAGGLTPAMVVDTGNARPDRANLRVINVPEIRSGPDSATQPPPLLLEVYVTPPGVSPAESAPIMAMDAYIASYSSLIYFDPGTWVVRFTRAGSVTVEAETAPLDIPAGEAHAVTLYRRADGGFATSVVRER